MKTKKIASSLVLVAILLFTVLTIGVCAETNTLPEVTDGKITLTDDVTLTSGYVVRAGTTLTIDLAGHTLTTIPGITADTIYVEKGATLTITGNGTITNNTKGYGALFNNGTVVIDGATLKRDTTGGNNWYVICNHGKMTIEKANVSVNGTGASLVENGYASYTNKNERSGYVEGVNEKNPTLKINGGTFDGGMNTIKNDDGAKLEINGGIYQNNYQVAVMNWNEATINDGTFKTPTGNDKTNLFVGSAGADTVNKGILTINGGVFEAEYLVEGYKGITTPVAIKGGTINATKGVVNEEIGKSHESLVKVEGIDITGEVTAPVTFLKYAKEGAIITINDEVKIGDKLEVPEGVKVVLPNENPDKVVVKNEDGSYTVEYKQANYLKVELVMKKVAELNKNDYKNFFKVEEAIKAIDYNKNITEQDVVDGYAKAIEDAIEKLEKKEVTNNEEEEVKNPQTSDNILVDVIIGVIALTTLAGIIIYKNK